MKKKLLVCLVTVLLLLTSIGMAHTSNLSKTEVSQLYVSIFGRASEGEGNAYWCSTQNNMVAAANTMLNTIPAKEYFGATLNDNQAFIKFIYENTLGKTYAEDPSGVNYWVSELANGKSKGQVIATLISAATDSQYSGLPSQDQFLNKVTVCNYTADMIATCPDVNDLSAFVDFISNVTSDSSSVETAISLIDSDAPTSFTGDTPTSFTMEWLAGKTLYNVWFGKGDHSDDEACVSKISFGADGSATYVGLKNKSESGQASYHVDGTGGLYFANDSTDTNKIVCGGTAQYIKTYYYKNGVFDNVNLYFYNEDEAMAYANSLTASIPGCGSE